MTFSKTKTKIKSNINKEEIINKKRGQSVINICFLSETARLQQNSELIKFPHTSPPQIITSFFDL
jgi:hypothetical protein